MCELGGLCGCWEGYVCVGKVFVCVGRLVV